MSNKIRVIFAEDVEILRKEIIRFLNRDKHIEVVGDANNAKDIVTIAQEIEFDIALLDIEMEKETSGIEAASAILAAKPQAKIIFLSSHESDEIIFSAIETGAIDYVIKSGELENLIDHIEKAYSNQVEIDWNVQKKMHKEFLRLRKREQNLLFFIRNIAILTPAEKSLISLLVQEFRIKEIADIRFVEVTTIKTQISRILKKLDMKRTKDIVTQIKKMKLESLFETESPNDDHA